MARISSIAAPAFLVIVMAIYGLRSIEEDSESHRSVVLFCAASNRAVIEACCQDYKAKTGFSVQVQYGASQTLLSSLEVSGVGDLFLPADESYLALARERSLITDQKSLAKMNAVVAVRKGNPKSVESFADLLRADVRLVQANPDAAAIGKVVRETLAKSRRWDDLAKATIAFRTSVTDVANDLVIGTADAGIVYDVVLHSYPDLQAIKLAEFDEVRSQVSIGLLSSTKHPQVAIQFLEYLTNKDGGLRLYTIHGFDVANAK